MAEEKIEQTNEEFVPYSGKFKLLIAISTPSASEWICEILQKTHAHGISIFWATGMNQSRGFAEMLGLKDNHKYLTLAYVQEEKVDDVLYTLQSELFALGAGTGIAFTIDIEAWADLKALMFLENELAAAENKEE